MSRRASVVLADVPCARKLWATMMSPALTCGTTMRGLRSFFWPSSLISPQCTGASVGCCPKRSASCAWLPGSHEQFAELFRQQPADAGVHWGEIKLLGQKKFLSPHMVVPHVKAGDIIVAHSFLAHGTSANRTDARRDMFFQRRAAQPLKDPATQADARQAFMRDPWLFFRQ